jgi:hypothetical protein
MLLPAEAQGLAQKGLSQSYKALLASLGDNRPCIVARATYQAYPVTATAILLQYLFPEFSLIAGRQLRIKAHGFARNAGGAPQTFLPVIRATQNAGNQVLGATTQINNTGSAVAWCIEADLSVSIPGAQGQYTPPVGSQNAATNTDVQASNLQPNEAIVIGGSLRTFISTNSMTGGIVSGGNLTATATPCSFMLESSDPNNTNLINSIPTLFWLELTPGANTTFSMIGGYIEAL